MPNLLLHVYGKHKRQSTLSPPLSEAVVNPVCICGTTKDVVHLIAICHHCDAITCTGRMGGCMKCARYNATVNTRTTTEHAREKQANG
jgi:hypothetical protein